jgi:aspartate kinase
VVVASGEQVTSGLLAITLQGMGLNARSYMGWQLPIRPRPRLALIDDIDADVSSGCSRGGIAVIPGFQGVAADGSVATLGRGGSDTSAVALAAAVRADRCDIYTDVDGVYTTDPRVVRRARKLPIITFEEMLELASVGAKVLQTRSVGLAMRERIPIKVLSSFDDRPGTMVVGDEELEGYAMERQLVTGIAYDKNEARVTLTGLPDRPATVAAIFAPLAEANINVDMIVQSVPARRATDHLHRPRTPRSPKPRHASSRQGEIGFASSTDTGSPSSASSGSASAPIPDRARACSRRWPSARSNLSRSPPREIKVSVLIPRIYELCRARAAHRFGLDDTGERRPAK